MKEHGWTQSETARSLSEAAMNLGGDLELMLTTENVLGEKQAGRDE
jgi:hypothetical protein